MVPSLHAGAHSLLHSSLAPWVPGMHTHTGRLLLSPHTLNPHQLLQLCCMLNANQTTKERLWLLQHKSGAPLWLQDSTHSFAPPYCCGNCRVSLTGQHELQKTCWAQSHTPFSAHVLFRDRFSLCSPSQPGTHHVDYASLELKSSACTVSKLLGLDVCTTTPGSSVLFSDLSVSSFELLPHEDISV